MRNSVTAQCQSINHPPVHHHLQPWPLSLPHDFDERSDRPESVNRNHNIKSHYSPNLDPSTGIILQVSDGSAALANNTSDKAGRHAQLDAQLAHLRARVSRPTAVRRVIHRGERRLVHLHMGTVELQYEKMCTLLNTHC